MRCAAVVLVRQGKAYIPTVARTTEGQLIEIEPVYTIALTLEDLVRILEQVATAGNPEVPVPDWKEFHRRYPTLEAAKVRSWKELARGGACYSIEWLGDGRAVLYVSMLDKRGRFEFDQAKTQHFPAEAGTRAIAETILADVQLRPELGT